MHIYFVLISFRFKNNENALKQQFNDGNRKLIKIATPFRHKICINFCAEII